MAKVTLCSDWLDVCSGCHMALLDIDDRILELIKHVQILSTPVYSRNVSSQLMAVLDRSYGTSHTRPLEGKVGGAIAVGRGTCGGQSITVMAIYNWMLSAGMICVPGELNGLTAVASEPGDVLRQEKRLKQASILGANVMRVAQTLRVT